MKLQEALTTFFVNVNQLATNRPLTDNEDVLGLLEEIGKLADKLGVDPTADGDTIEMAIAAKLKD